MHFCSTPTEPSREESPNTSAVVYEEIGDVMDSFKYTQNILYGYGEGLDVFISDREGQSAGLR